MIKLLENANWKYPGTKIFIEEDLRKTTKQKEEVIYFVFAFFEQIDVLLFHVLTIFL